MKITRLFIFFILISIVSCKTEIEETANFTRSSEIFDINSLPVIYIHFTETEWNTLLSNFDINPFNEVNVQCNFTFSKGNKTQELVDCGIRIKGNTSRRRPEGQFGEAHSSTNPNWHHAHFSIDFNHFISNQRLAGLKKINLKWFKDDSMYAREVYCYDLFHRYGIDTAPRSSYCQLKLQIGNESIVHYGVYELLEAVDEIFVKERKHIFGDENGHLWKANWGADLVNKDPNKMGIEIAELYKTQKPVYDFKGDSIELAKAKIVLIQFIDSLNNKKGGDFPEWMERATDLNLLLKTYNVSTLCGMWDDYWINKNNYYFYINSEGKFFLIPYDYDNTLGTSQIIPDAGTQDLLKWGKDSHPLIKRIISFEKYKEKYIQNFYELCDPNNNYFDAAKSMARIQKWHNLILNHIPNDTFEDMEIIDQPAWWGNCPHYRLLSEENNYFIIRASNLPAKL